MYLRLVNRFILVKLDPPQFGKLDLIARVVNLATGRNAVRVFPAFLVENRPTVMSVSLVLERLAEVYHRLLQGLRRHFLQPVELNLKAGQPLYKVVIADTVPFRKCQGVVVYEPATTACTVDERTLRCVRT